MKAIKLVSKANATVESFEKHGRRVDSKVITKSNVIFIIGMGSGHNTLHTHESNVNVPNGLKLINCGFQYTFTPDNIRFGLTDDEILSVLSIN